MEQRKKGIQKARTGPREKEKMFLPEEVPRGRGSHRLVLVLAAQPCSRFFATLYIELLIVG